MADAPRRKKVVIFGGGVTGLSAAHELIERDFDVVVVEEREDRLRPGQPDLGGMARTQWARVPGRDFQWRMQPEGMRPTRPVLPFAQGEETSAICFAKNS